ncbi:hypothetical protein RHGRI_038674 [Rhododendron griersonianum]|uniref:Protein kinase domain-containing protein n=1 Tax=Rhododendron griersonianum TaxID=479676 RepID=A0AAV6HID4_9ERIC|nr:hypothetical protein RHGRI_038674 [Rhododendron griersonianum]
MDGTTTVVVFDFDHTMIEDNSDTWVVEQMGLTPLFDQLRRTLPWFTLIASILLLYSQSLQLFCLKKTSDRMMEELHSRGKTIEEITECLRRVPMNPRVISAIRKAHSLPRCELRIISDANQFFIETILKQFGLFDCFTEIVTNRSIIEGGRLRIFPYHSSPHGCNLCPPNLCKKLLEQITITYSIMLVGSPFGHGRVRDRFNVHDRSSGIIQSLLSASEMEKNPFVQAGALSTDLGEKNPFDQAGGIDGGVDQLKESCRFIPLCQILKATNDFDDALVVGTGGFGKVYKANIDDGATTTVVAIKRLSAVSNQGAEQFWTEVKLLSKLRHTNLVSLFGYCNENQEMILVYKYINQGALADHLYKTSREESGGSRSHLTWEQRLNICLDTACGLDYLHNGTLPGIIHRDVKSTNILLDEYLVAKVSDFGISKSMTTYLTTHVSTNVKGTFGYLDPDYFLTCRLTKKSDVYAFGVVLLEVLCGRPAIDTRLDEKQINLVNWAKINIKKGKLDRIIDPSLNGDITPHSLEYFAELASESGRPPDQHGEKNPSPTCKTLSTNGQTKMGNEIVGHLEETNEFLPDFVEGPNGVSSECEFQLKNQWSRFSAYPNSDGPVVPHPHMASTQILGENMESLGDLRNLLPLVGEPFLQGHVSGSMWTVPPCLDQAPSRLMPTIAHTMGSSDDLRNLLPLVGEPFSTGHVSGSIDWTVPPCLDQAPSQLMPTIAHTTGSSDDLRNLLPLVGEPFSAGHVSGSINWTVPPCSVPAPSQPMPTIAHTMGNSDDLRNLLALVEEPFPARQAFGSVSWTGPSCSDPALSQLMPTIPHTMPTIPRMVPLLTERKDTRSVKLRATYGDTTIQFNLPLTSGIRELNKEVLKRLEFELGRFKVEYEDEDGVLILIACDDDVRDYLQFLTSSGNQVIKPLVLKKVPNITNVGKSH